MLDSTSCVLTARSFLVLSLGAKYVLGLRSYGGLTIRRYCTEVVPVERLSLLKSAVSAAKYVVGILSLSDRTGQIFFRRVVVSETKNR